MRAVVLEAYGGPEVLQIKEIPDPEPGAGEVRVRVAATALNRADVLQRRGHYPQPGPRPQYEIPGLEFAGVVDRVGPGVVAWKPGDRVCGLLAGGGYAEYVVTHERLLMPIPDGLSLEEGAAIPEVFFTA
ncbi:MAG TPA: alcohol dehydrogenase catalytic domain-containing protein, partial [Bacillota bacterium]